MARIAFFQEELRERFAFMSLSAVLKQRGHNCEVFIEHSSKNLIKDILTYKPDIVAFSAMTAGFNKILKVAHDIKSNSKALTIIGGPHATFFPEEVIEKTCFDSLCMGEGEQTILDLANNITNPNSLKNTKNLWYKIDNNIYKNDVRNLQDINLIPEMDRTLYYDKYPELSQTKTKRFLLVRGCPFDCSYCFNHALKKIYRGKGPFVRFRNKDLIIKEMLNVKNQYGMDWVLFAGDTININKNWFFPFLNEYTKHINLPYLANVRIDYVDEEIAAKMKASKCDRVDFGVEHGNEKIRRELFNRPMSNDEIINNAKHFHKHKIRMHTSSILGIPNEDLKLAYETVLINSKIKPELAVSSTLHPYKKTEIYDYVINNNLMSGHYEAERGYSFQPSFDRKEFSCSVMVANERQIINLYFWFDFFVKHTYLFKFLKPLLNLPPNRFYNMIKAFPVLQIEFKYASSIYEKLKILKSWLCMAFKKIT